MPLLALDFDGVLCDSADETGATGWLAAGERWPTHCVGEPTAAYLAAFRQLRPVVETGYESLLVARLYAAGTPVETLLQDFKPLAAALCAVNGLTREPLIAQFGACRDRQLATQPAAWLARHRCYPGVVAAVNGWVARGLPVAIITTKERRFLRALADWGGLQVPADMCFALEDGPKLGVLRRLLAAHPGAPQLFVEDRLATLTALAAETDLAALHLRLADWGYVAPADLARAATLPRVQRLALADFPTLA